MVTKSFLDKSKANKNDEFYTQYQDVKEMVEPYKEFFHDKVVFCNCDDYRWSNFYKFFKDVFEEYGLKKLYAVGYDVNGGLYAEYDGKVENTKVLNGNGSFDSEESIDVLNKSDIVVTNPPFSRLKSWFMTIKDKKFLFICPLLVFGYVWMLPYIKEEKIFVGIRTAKPMWFITEEGDRKKITNVILPTNLKRDEIKIPTERTIVDINKDRILLDNGTELPKYDNFDSYECKFIKNFPKDLPDGIRVGCNLNVVKYLTKDNSDFFLTAACLKTEDFPRVNGKIVFSRFIVDNRILK